jgi:hypothetical protein
MWTTAGLPAIKTFLPEDRATETGLHTAVAQPSKPYGYHLKVFHGSEIVAPHHHLRKLLAVSRIRGKPQCTASEISRNNLEPRPVRSEL